MQLWDGARIEQLARELTVAAHRVGDRRQALRAAAQRLAWRSPAANAFEAMLSATLGQLADAERRLDGLAGQLRGHGERAGHRAEIVARTARTAARSAAQVSRSVLPRVRSPW
jgi:hypothetical protein